MNAQLVASLAFTSMFSLSTLLSPAHAEEPEKALISALFRRNHKKT
ncbi:hypothetical protein ACNKHU_25640 [Shigella flexneri]